VQRCYYQPVTCYETRKYYECVTSYRTSYYWEPVTSYRYSCYFDPCTCRYQQVACPTTCYKLRTQCCPVQNWVERCCQVPVVRYQQCSYWEPVTTCYQPPPCPPATAYNGGVAPVTPGVSENGYGAPPVTPGTLQPGFAKPGVGEQRYTPVPDVKDYRGSYSPLYDRTYPVPDSTLPGGGTFRQPRLQGPARPGSPEPPVAHPERVASAPSGRVEGMVVRGGNLPQPGARVLFVSMSRQGPQESVTADAAGQFRVALASGGWLVYLQGADGKPVFHSKMDVRDNETRQVTLQSR
jgi:hypothetical protein